MKRRRRRRRWKRMTGHVKRAYGALSDCPPRGRQAARWQRVYCYIKRIYEAYGTHQCPLMSCACAYCALLSLVPLLVIGIAAYGYLMGSPQHALASVVGELRGYTPNTEFMNGVREILERIFEDRGLIGAFGLLGLLFAAHQLFMAMEPAMNLIWVVPETRHWVRQRLIAIGLTLVSIVLLGIDLAASALFVYLQGRPERVFSSHTASLLMRGGVFITPMVVVTLLFVLLYRYLPCREVPWKPAVLGASIAALFWQITKVGFSLFLVHVNTYYRLYGSLGSLVVLVVWAYYSMSILLLGAEIAADYESTRHGVGLAEERAHAGADLAAANGTPTATVTTLAPLQKEKASR